MSHMEIITSSTGEHQETCELGGCSLIIGNAWVEYEGKRFCDDPHKIKYQHRRNYADLKKLGVA